MADQEFICWIIASMDDRQRQSKRMWDVLDTVHQASLASVDFQDTASIVARQESLNCIAFHASNPFCLCQCALLNDFARFKKVTVGIARESTSLNLSNAFYICWDC
jgi:hypothetical protein